MIGEIITFDLTYHSIVYVAAGLAVTISFSALFLAAGRRLLCGEGLILGSIVAGAWLLDIAVFGRSITSLWEMVAGCVTAALLIAILNGLRAALALHKLEYSNS